ncbi:phosphatase PAP2 family protein [Afifella sp. IM 167]|uniref:phosphatase PAP2 family protein n=1 Tax=Afifella sp. IM 167 TaxID=2033586 RepID=UPI001CCA4B3A|nr:phosphatase PAP2 family protein [Afifella sp. IM 167]
MRARLPKASLPEPLARALSRAKRQPVLAALAALLVVALVFAALPVLDLAVSRAFWADGAFVGTSDGTARFVRNFARIVEALVALAVGLPLVFKLVWPESRLLIAPRIPLFLYAVFALGPGLIVNGILKAHSGRPRPRHLAEFGGDALFARVGDFSGSCLSNCSFVSGEAASAFWLVALVFVVPKAWRAPVLLASILLAAAASWSRVAMGGHFLSDVLIAWLVTLLVMLLVKEPVLRRFQPALDRAIEAGIARLGRFLRYLLWKAGRAREKRRAA